MLNWETTCAGNLACQGRLSIVLDIDTHIQQHRQRSSFSSSIFISCVPKLHQFLNLFHLQHRPCMAKITYDLDFASSWQPCDYLVPKSECRELHFAFFSRLGYDNLPEEGSLVLA